MVKCIGKNSEGIFCMCACIVRQVKGCSDIRMKSGENVRKNFIDIIRKLDWSKVTVYKGTNNFYEPCVCLCLNGPIEPSCEKYMKPVEMTMEKLIEEIEGMIC